MLLVSHSDINHKQLTKVITFSVDDEDNSSSGQYLWISFLFLFLSLCTFMYIGKTKMCLIKDNDHQVY